MDKFDKINVYMKWFIIGVVSFLLILSTIFRLVTSLGADRTLCMVFIIVAGLVFGANLIGLFKK